MSTRRIEALEALVDLRLEDLADVHLGDPHVGAGPPPTRIASFLGVLIDASVRWSLITVVLVPPNAGPRGQRAPGRDSSRSPLDRRLTRRRLEREHPRGGVREARLIGDERQQGPLRLDGATARQTASAHPT